MKRAALATALLAATVLLGACSGDSRSDKVEPSNDQTPVAGTDAQDGSDAALVVTTDTPKSDSCFVGPPPAHLAWFEVQWKALEELDSFRFSLVNPKGVESVGQVYTVPPVNFGGRIDYGGTAAWDGWREALNDRFLSVSEMDQVVSWTPIEGQTGLLVFHLRFNRKALTTEGASFDGVKATYTTADGETGDVEVATHQVFGAGDRC